MLHRTKGRHLLLAVLAIPALILFTGCSDDDDPLIPPADPSVTETVGPAGGQITIPDQVTLDIPAAAVAADVDFVLKMESSPPALPAGYVAVSDAFSIEPSGTTFAEDAALTLFYDESAIPQFLPEDELLVMSHSGQGWVQLSGSINPDTDAALAAVPHLCYFIVVAPVPDPPADVYLEFEIERVVYGDPDASPLDGYDSLGVDIYSASPTKADERLYGGEVAYGPWALTWLRDSYYYSSDTERMFLDPATNYDLVIPGSLEVTPLTFTVATMAGVPAITNVTDGGELPLEGFEITWDGTGQGGSMEIHLESYTDGSIFRTSDNTGSFTFTEQTLAPLAAGAGEIRLVWMYETPIGADGYLAESRTEYHTEHRLDVTFTGGGGAPLLERMEASLANLAIPDATVSGSGTPVSDVINMPVTGVVDSVRVYLDISHTWMSDLVCKLTSPDGTELRVLFIGEGGETDGRMQGWYPDDFTPKDDLNGFDGENAGGNWTLTCQDHSYDAAGTLNLWRLQVFYR